MTLEAEKALDEKAARVYDRTSAVMIYLEGFFDLKVKAAGHRGADATRSMTGDVQLTAFLADGQWFNVALSPDLIRMSLDQAEDRLFPGLGSGTNPDVEAAYLFRPQWVIEKESALDLTSSAARRLPRVSRSL